MAAGVADLFQRRDRPPRVDLAGLGVLAAFIALLIVRIILKHVHNQPFGERVHDRCAHAVQAAGIGVVLVVELAAGVQLRVDHLDRGYAQLRVDVHRYAAAVVGHRAGAVPAQRDGDLVGIAVGGLVYGVVDDLPDQMMKAARAGRADVHSGAHTHRVQSLEHLYVAGLIFFSVCHVFLH